MLLHITKDLRNLMSHHRRSVKPAVAMVPCSGAYTLGEFRKELCRSKRFWFMQYRCPEVVHYIESKISPLCTAQNYRTLSFFLWRNWSLNDLFAEQPWKLLLEGIRLRKFQESWRCVLLLLANLKNSPFG